MDIRRETISALTATGGAGAATATATSSPINGIIRAVYLDYQDSPPGTTDVTLVEDGTAPVQTVLSVANAATDGWFYPMAQGVLNSTGAAITNQGTLVVVNRPLTLTIAQANNDDGVIATIIYESR
jgi:hypothetical protein